MNAVSRFFQKWGSGGIRRSLERKRLRREQRRLVSVPDRPQQSSSVDHLLLSRYPACSKLATYAVPASTQSRVSIVTDSINAGSLYGGVGTALMLGALIAEKCDVPLRIITRTEPPATGNLQQILRLIDIELCHEPQFLFAPPLKEDAHVDLLPGEKFITTSWWTTSATLGTVPAKDIYYLLQEDERMFYAFGDERLSCERVIGNGDISYIVNSNLLYQHLLNEGFENVSKRGIPFEPAFPRSIFHRRPRKDRRQRFMFYARPNHARNLFYFGLEVIQTAVSEGLFDYEGWEIVLVGKDIPKVTFDGINPAERKEGMSWQEYGEFIGSVDVALSLMSTPHPSYPPLDLASSGAVVVTNAFMNKKSLSHYSENILTAELDVSEMVRALRLAVTMADDELLRGKNAASSSLGTNWRDQLEPVVEWVGG